MRNWIKTKISVERRSDIEMEDTLKNLGIKNSMEIETAWQNHRVDLDEIYAYRPYCNDIGVEEERSTIIYMKSSESFIIQLSIKELDELMGI